MMTKPEALTVIRDLLAQRLAELAEFARTLAADPQTHVPASTRRQLRQVDRWQAIVGGSEPGPDDLPDILTLIASELEKRRLANKLARGQFAGVVSEAIAVAAAEWERLDNARLAIVLPQAAAVLSY